MAEPEVIEGDIVPVDQHDATQETILRDTHLLPDWARSRAALTDNAVRLLRRSLHLTAFHLIRLPLYWLRIVNRSPFGVARIGSSVRRWMLDERGEDRLKGLPADNPHYAKMDAQHDELVAKNRKIVALLTLEGLLAAAICVILLRNLPWQTVAGTVAGILTMLGLAGRTPEVPITSRATNTEDVPRFDSDLIIIALGSLGIPALAQAVKSGLGIGFPNPIVREGKGYRSDIDLPAGVTASDVIEKRDKLASALRRPLSSVWPEGDDGIHAGRLILFVSDKPLSQTRQGEWPLSVKGAVDLFEPQPIGIDPRGGTVTQVLMFASKIIGAVPRVGKTFSLRLDLLIAALCVHAQVYVFCLKGSPDLMPLEPIAHRYRIGSDAEDIEYIALAFDELRADMVRRYKTLRSLPRNICPEGKVTPELAKDRRYGLHPVVVGMDECQIAFEDPDYGQRIEKAVTDLVKRGPAVGIIIILATQRPDAKSLPTGISANAILRFCLKVMGQVENDMVLGTSSYKNGIRATQFGRKEKGVGYLAGEGDDPVIVRTYYVDGPQAEKIVARAHAARVKAGTLTGHAAGQEMEADEPETDSILDHVATVWPLNRKSAWYADIALWLQEGPDKNLYQNLGQKAVAEALRDKGVPGEDVNLRADGETDRKTRRGCYHLALIDALAKQNAERGATWPQQSDANPDVDEPSKEN